MPKFEQPVSQKTFFKGDKVQLKWNKLGASLIVLAQTDVDKSNRSYYGETNMYILSANGGFDSRIDLGKSISVSLPPAISPLTHCNLDKEGPIHDVTWSPSSKEFGVVYGYMPAKTTIFNTQAEATHSFSLSPRNTILFSPHGRFVLVAGFGNLAGQCDIYDLDKDYAKVATIEASNASICEWSPDGKHIMTATTSPRLRVDNGVRIWHVCGGLMYNEDMMELYDVTWRPQFINKQLLEDPLYPVPTPHASALAYLGTVKTPSKSAGAYRPPGARGTSTPLHFKREDEGGAAFIRDGLSSTPNGDRGVNGFGKPRRREIPGAEPAESSRPLPPGAAPGGGVSLTTDKEEEGLSKAALKNRKKREAKKVKEAEQKKVDGEASGIVGGKALEVDNLGAKRDQSRSRRDASRPRRDQSRARTPGPGRPQSRAQSHGPLASPSPSPAKPRKQPNTIPTGPRAHTSYGGKQQPASGKAPPPLKNQSNPNGQVAATKIDVPPVPDIQETLASPLTPGAGSPHEKKVRALFKKLRAIDELKMRQAGGEQLELSQVSKIESEEKVRRELEEVNGSAV